MMTLLLLLLLRIGELLQQGIGDLILFLRLAAGGESLLSRARSAKGLALANVHNKQDDGAADQSGGEQDGGDESACMDGVIAVDAATAVEADVGRGARRRRDRR